ncbi:MAG: amidohydrolase [Ardenticatenaceae bacterium]|nr:amidohydrolase [Ardenticatenaceae bacterium]HBY93770.1 amidohydrolase [Chloroflexota bacterium]
MTPDFVALAKSLEDEMIARRRDFHRHPELGFQEVQTAGLVAAELHQLGVEVRTGVGRTGVVGVLEGDRPGPTILLRFDMDALPIAEANSTDYVSQTPGVMHACGHDGHTAIGLAVVKMLAPLRQQMAGRVKFVFQPAEEGLGGALAMVKDGVMESPAPDRSLALHMWNEKPVGWVAATDGPAMAASDKFTITLQGKGGHGALPFQSKDPVVAAAQIISALQTVVARNVNALDSAVVSVTSIQGGEAFNVIPDSVNMRGTIRTFTPNVREVVARRFEQVVRGIAEALGCLATIELEVTTPAVVNDSQMSTAVRALAQNLSGVTHVVGAERTMGSEDMAYMMEKVPGCYFFVGSANPERGLDFPHHHPRFDFDERALPLGAALMAQAAASYVLDSG